MTFIFEHSDEDGEHSDRHPDVRSAMRAAREEWNLKWESDRRDAVDGAKGHRFRVVDESTGAVVHDWATHYTDAPGRFTLPREYGEYLDGIVQVPASDLVRDALGNPRKAAELWVHATYKQGPEALSRVEGLRDTLGIGLSELTDVLEMWFRQEWLDYTVANARDDMADIIPDLIMDDGLSVREAQVIALERLGFRPTESLNILIELTGRQMALNNVTNALKTARMKMGTRLP